MQTRGNILIIMLLMLLFASAILLQLREDNYLSRLVERQVGNLFSARALLIMASSGAASLDKQVCSFAADTKSELEKFWQSRQALCQMSLSGAKIDYAFREFKMKGKALIYQQQTFRIENKTQFEWLRVVKVKSSGVIVAWTYHWV